MRFFAAAAALTACLTLGGTPAEAWPDLVVNGNFDQSSYTANSQFGTPYGGQGVTGWTGGTGYQIYFFGGTDTTVSADNQWGSSSEKLYGPAGGNTSPAGGNFIAMDGDQTSGIQGSISQLITGLVAGLQYQVKFDWGAGQVQSKTGATTEQVKVSLGSQSFTTPVVNNASQSFYGWMSASFTFTAQSASQVLSFLAVGTPTGGPPVVTLDGISLSLVPEPRSALILAAGLLGLIGVRRLRRS